MKRYIKLPFLIAKACLIRILEFRSETISWSFFGLLWALMMLVFVNVIFSQVSEIGGWSKGEVLVLFTVQEIFIGVMWAFLIPGIIDFSRAVRKGDLDFLFLKPMPARFLVTFQRFEFDQYFRIAVLIFLLGVFLNNLGINLSVISLTSFLVLFLMGIIIFYSLFFSVSIISFWFINLFNLEDLFDSVLNVGKYPYSIFQGGAKFIFLYVIPIGFISAFPTQALLGNSMSLAIPIALILTIVTFSFSQLFWSFALKRYSSASS